MTPQGGSSRLSLGETLRQHREAAGLTQEALAKRSGVSVDTISQWERGLVRRPRRSTLKLLAEALQLDQAAVEPFLAAARPAPRPNQEPSPPRRRPTRRWQLLVAVLLVPLSGGGAAAWVVGGHPWAPRATSHGTALADTGRKGSRASPAPSIGPTPGAQPGTPVPESPAPPVQALSGPGAPVGIPVGSVSQRSGGGGAGPVPGSAPVAPAPPLALRKPSGTVTIEVASQGYVSITPNLTGMTPFGQYSLGLYSATCGSSGRLLDGFPDVTASASGTASQELWGARPMPNGVPAGSSIRLGQPGTTRTLACANVQDTIRQYDGYQTHVS